MILKMLRPKTAVQRPVAARQAAHHLAHAAARRAAGQPGLSPAPPPLPSLAVLVVASLTDPIVQFAVDVVDAMGLPGIFLLMVAESACIPIPSETTFLFAGFNVSEGEYSMFAGRRRRARSRTSSAPGSPTRSATSAASTSSRSTARSCTSSPRTCSGRTAGSSATARDGVLHAHAADHPHVHLAARGRRADAVLALHGADHARLHPVDLHAHVHRRCRSATSWESWKDSLHYVDYAVAAMIVIGVAYLVVRARRRKRAAAG